MNQKSNVASLEFDELLYRNLVVSDLTYVRIGMNWNYLCVFVDFFNCEIIGYSADPHKAVRFV